MLYQMFETQRALMSPFSEFAYTSAKLYTHPLSPFSKLPLAPRVSAGLTLMHRLAKEYEKPQFNIHTVNVDGVDVAVQERVAMSKPFCRLLRFKRFTDDQAMLSQMKDQPKVLVVAPLSGHHSTLLRETVRELLHHHKVFITDWTDARMVPVDAGPFSLDDYVYYVQEFIRHIGPEVNVISVCQPTVPVLGAVSLMATEGEPTPRTLTMMGGPIDARMSPTTVNDLATDKSHKWFETSVIYSVPQNYPGYRRRVYPGFMQHAGFIAMNPDRHLKSHYDYFMNLVRGDGESAESHREFYDEYNAVLDIPAEFYLDTIKTVFQEFSLVYGTWKVGGKLVRPQDITGTALLTVEGELDDIAGIGQTRAAHGLCTGIPKEDQFHYEAKGAGHYGIFSGRRWRENVYPEVRAFIAKYHPAVAGVEPAGVVNGTVEVAKVEDRPKASARRTEGVATAALTRAGKASAAKPVSKPRR